MKFGIMQAYLLPYIGYFQLIDYVDEFMIYEHVSFRKKSWITRNRILDKGSNTPININVPIIKQSSAKTIGETFINDTTNWRSKILNLIFYNYKKTPFFESIYPIIESIILTKSPTIHYYNSHAIKKISEVLDINTPIKTNNNSSIEDNLSYLSLQNNVEKKTQRIFEICMKEQADTYVNPIGGMELYDKMQFQENGIQLKFTQTLPFTYPQFNDEFNPHLSIVDVLMHNGIEGTKVLLQNYKII